MKTDEIKFKCPLCDREITDDDCFMIAFVAEGIAPDEALPDFADPDTVTREKKTCLNCKYHPE